MSAAIALSVLCLFAPSELAAAGAPSTGVPQEPGENVPVEVQAPAAPVGDQIHVALQAGLFAAAGWFVAAPAVAAFFVATSGLLPPGFAPLVLIPMTPLLLLGPPLALAAAGTLGAWGKVSLWGLVAIAGIAGTASAGAALVIGPPVLWRLLTPSDQSNPDALYRVTYTLAAGSMWLLPAAAGGLAASITAPFFLQTASSAEE